MSATDIGPSKVHWLAERLEDDIRARSLRAGDPYLTTTEAGRLLGISKAMAHRAMKILVARQVLVSHLGRGTFVGPTIGESPSERMKCIYVLLTQDLFQSSGVATYGWLAGLFDALPGYGIQFNFVPPRDAETYAKRLLEEGLAGGMLSAVVLLGCPRVVQEQAFHHGAPALVLGTDYSSTRQLPSVDADQFETGRLAAEYLVEKGHRRIAILMREMWFPGDQRMFEGVGRALDDAGLGHDALTLCNLSLDAPALNADLQRLLTGEDCPTGCVCRTPFFARAAVQAAESLGLAVPGDLEIICDGLDRQAAASLGLPSVCMKMGVEEQVAIGGRMLAQLFEGRQPDPLHVVLPVELVAPKRPENGRLKPNRRRRSAVSRKTK